MFKLHRVSAKQNAIQFFSMNEWWYVALAVLMLFHGRDAFRLVTLLVVALCTLLQVLPLNLWDVCMSVNATSLFRIIFHNFVHVGVQHWFYNMVAWLMCAPVLEQERGSTVLFAILCAAIIIDNIMYSCIALEIFPWTRWLSSGCTVGLSGIIFCFETLLARSGTAQPCDVLGMVCKRSLKLVFIDLIIIQVLGNNVSFYAHASGVLGGLAVHWLMPYANRAVQSRQLGPIVARLNSWMKHFSILGKVCSKIILRLISSYCGGRTQRWTNMQIVKPRPSHRKVQRGDCSGNDTVHRIVLHGPQPTKLTGNLPRHVECTLAHLRCGECSAVGIFARRIGECLTWCSPQDDHVSAIRSGSYHGSDDSRQPRSICQKSYSSHCNLNAHIEHAKKNGPSDPRNSTQPPEKGPRTLRNKATKREREANLNGHEDLLSRCMRCGRNFESKGDAAKHAQNIHHDASVIQQFRADRF